MIWMLSDTNELFMRTNANGVYGQSAGNDKITSTNTVTGSGTYNITVFDQGMRNGYNNAADADTKGHLDQDVVLIENADKGGTYNIKEMKYDNGVWSYEYEGKADIVDDGLNLTQVTTRLQLNPLPNGGSGCQQDRSRSGSDSVRR